MGKVHIFDAALNDALDRAEKGDKETVNKCYKLAMSRNEADRIDAFCESVENVFFSENPEIDHDDFLLLGISLVSTYTSEMTVQNKLEILKVLVTKMEMNVAIITSGGA